MLIQHNNSGKYGNFLSIINYLYDKYIKIYDKH